MVHRQCKPLLSNSFFLFGPRATGKTTLINGILASFDPLVFDLLSPELEEQLSTDPHIFRDRCIAAHNSGRSWVMVDEVQRVPKVLNIIHQLIESHKIKFAITGSSARKLKRGAANLLAGRAFLNHLHPLTHIELGAQFDLDETLSWGTLPKIHQLSSDEEKSDYLRSYVATFIQQEIKAEQLVRKLDPFRRFLEVAAQSHATIVNFSNIAKDVGVDTKTVQNYFQILEDTMLGSYLLPFHTSARKALSKSPKFYFFDLGVQRALSKQLPSKPSPGSSMYGDCFESLFILECQRLNDYKKMDFDFSYLRTKDDVEIDLIIRRPGQKLVAIEIKSSTQVGEVHLKRFAGIGHDLGDVELIVASREPVARLWEDIEVMPWSEALKKIFSL